MKPSEQIVEYVKKVPGRYDDCALHGLLISELSRILDEQHERIQKLEAADGGPVSLLEAVVKRADDECAHTRRRHSTGGWTCEDCNEYLGVEL